MSLSLVFPLILQLATSSDLGVLWIIRRDQMCRGQFKVGKFAFQVLNAIHRVILSGSSRNLTLSNLLEILAFVVIVSIVSSPIVVSVSSSSRILLPSTVGAVAVAAFGGWLTSELPGIDLPKDINRVNGIVFAGFTRDVPSGTLVQASLLIRARRLHYL